MSSLFFFIVAVASRPFAVWTFDHPAVSIGCDDKGTAFILDASGETVAAFDPATGTVRTIVLPERLSPVNGVRADPLYLYLFSDNSFYRLKKITNELDGPFPEAGSDSLKIVDLDIASNGDIFIADGFGDRVVSFDGLGNERALGAGFLSRPKALRYTPAGEIVVVNGGRSRLSFFNRIGNLVREFPLPSSRISLVAVDTDNIVYVGEANTNHLWRFANGRFDRCPIATPFAATAIGASAGKLYVLDAAIRLLVFDLHK